MTSQRIQRQRTKGWRMPEGAVYVGRPSKWGNPCSVVKDGLWYVYLNGRDVGGPYGVESMARSRAAQLYAEMVHTDSLCGLVYIDVPEHEARLLPVAELAGRDLACWCPLGQPCHADVLLTLATTRGVA